MIDAKAMASPFGKKNPSKSALEKLEQKMLVAYIEPSQNLNF
jgi:hypothetical protein